MDEVFGGENFVATIVWEEVYSTKSSAQNFSENHDIVVVYVDRTELSKRNLLPRTKKADARYRNLDYDPRGPWKPSDISARNPYRKGSYSINYPGGRQIDGPPPGNYWRFCPDYVVGTTHSVPDGSRCKKGGSSTNRAPCKPGGSRTGARTGSTCCRAALQPQPDTAHGGRLETARSDRPDQPRLFGTADHQDRQQTPRKRRACTGQMRRLLNHFNDIRRQTAEIGSRRRGVGFALSRRGWSETVRVPPGLISLCRAGARQAQRRSGGYPTHGVTRFHMHCQLITRKIMYTRLSRCMAVVSVVALAFFVASCDLSEPATEATPFGIVVPQSGTLSATGASMKYGMDLAFRELSGIEDLPGDGLAWITTDSKSTVAGAKEAFEVLAQTNGVLAVLGPYTSSSTDAIIPLADDYKVVVFSPTSAAQGLGEKSAYLFRSTLTVDRLAPTGVRVTQNAAGYTRVATITNDSDTFSRSSRDAFTSEFARLPEVTVVTAQAFERSQDESLPDLTQQLNEIRAANADAVLISALPPGRIGVIKQARALGMTDITIIVPMLDTGEVKSINEAAAGAADGVYTVQVWIASNTLPASQAFVTAYSNEYGTPPDGYAARSYAATIVLGEALRLSGSASDREALRVALKTIEDFDTVLGSFSFDANGDALYDPVVGQVTDGQFVVVE